MLCVTLREMRWGFLFANYIIPYFKWMNLKIAEVCLQRQFANRKIDRRIDTPTANPQNWFSPPDFDVFSCLVEITFCNFFWTDYDYFAIGRELNE